MSMTSGPKRLFIITGDHSGDIHGAKVVRALKAQNPKIQIAAVGGKNLAETGVELISDQSKMGRVGFGSVLGAPYHYLLSRKILKFLDTFKPDAVLHIDYGVFNLYMAAQLKKRDIKTLYFIPPQVWATRKGRLKKIKARIDHVFCIFPFEEKMYQDHGIPVTYVGHPLVGQLPPPVDRETFCREHGLDPTRPIVGIFPGSRKLEIDYLLKPLLQTVPLILEKQPTTQFIVAKASSLSDGFFKERLNQAFQGMDETSSSRVSVVENLNHALLSVADIALLASGTVTLEAALYKTPMVIIYKLHPIVMAIALRLAYMPSIGLPNILTDPYHPIIKELLGDAANPQQISQAALPLFDHTSTEYQSAKHGFEQIEQLLNTGDTPTNVARGILTFFNNK